MALPSKPVLDYCFTSASLSRVMGDAGGGFTEKISDVNDFQVLFQNDNIFSVPEKFFNVTGTEFYEYKDL